MGQLFKTGTRLVAGSGTLVISMDNGVLRKYNIEHQFSTVWVVFAVVVVVVVVEPCVNLTRLNNLQTIFLKSLKLKVDGSTAASLPRNKSNEYFVA